MADPTASLEQQRLFVAMEKNPNMPQYLVASKIASGEIKVSNEEVKQKMDALYPSKRDKSSSHYQTVMKGIEESKPTPSTPSSSTQSTSNSNQPQDANNLQLPGRDWTKEKVGYRSLTKEELNQLTNDLRKAGKLGDNEEISSGNARVYNDGRVELTNVDIHGYEYKDGKVLYEYSKSSLNASGIIALGEKDKKYIKEHTPEENIVAITGDFKYAPSPENRSIELKNATFKVSELEQGLQTGTIIPIYASSVQTESGEVIPINQPFASNIQIEKDKSTTTYSTLDNKLAFTLTETNQQISNNVVGGYGSSSTSNAKSITGFEDMFNPNTATQNFKTKILRDIQNKEITDAIKSTPEYTKYVSGLINEKNYEVLGTYVSTSGKTEQTIKLNLDKEFYKIPVNLTTNEYGDKTSMIIPAVTLKGEQVSKLNYIDTNAITGPQYAKIVLTQMPTLLAEAGTKLTEIPKIVVNPSNEIISKASVYAKSFVSISTPQKLITDIKLPDVNKMKIGNLEVKEGKIISLEKKYLPEENNIFGSVTKGIYQPLSETFSTIGYITIDIGSYGSDVVTRYNTKPMQIESTALEHAGSFKNPAYTFGAVIPTTIAVVATSGSSAAPGIAGKALAVSQAIGKTAGLSYGLALAFETGKTLITKEPFSTQNVAKTGTKMFIAQPALTFASQIGEGIGLTINNVVFHKPVSSFGGLVLSSAGSGVIGFGSASYVFGTPTERESLKFATIGGVMMPIFSVGALAFSNKFNTELTTKYRTYRIQEAKDITTNIRDIPLSKETKHFMGKITTEGEGHLFNVAYGVDRVGLEYNPLMQRVGIYYDVSGTKQFAGIDFSKIKIGVEPYTKAIERGMVYSIDKNMYVIVPVNVRATKDFMSVIATGKNQEATSYFYNYYYKTSSYYNEFKTKKFTKGELDTIYSRFLNVEQGKYTAKINKFIGEVSKKAPTTLYGRNLVMQGKDIDMLIETPLGEFSGKRIVEEASKKAGLTAKEMGNMFDIHYYSTLTSNIRIGGYGSASTYDYLNYGFKTLMPVHYKGGIYFMNPGEEIARKFYTVRYMPYLGGTLITEERRQKDILHTINIAKELDTTKYGATRSYPVDFQNIKPTTKLLVNAGNLPMLKSSTSVSYPSQVLSSNMKITISSAMLGKMDYSTSIKSGIISQKIPAVYVKSKSSISSKTEYIGSYSSLYSKVSSSMFSSSNVSKSISRSSSISSISPSSSSSISSYSYRSVSSPSSYIFKSLSSSLTSYNSEYSLTYTIQYPREKTIITPNFNYKFGRRPMKIEKETRYTPSVISVMKNIYSTKMPTNLTPFTIRPIIVSEADYKKMFKIQKSKKR